MHEEQMNRQATGGWLPCWPNVLMNTTDHTDPYTTHMDQQLVLKLLPCQAPGTTAPGLGLTGPVSIYCEWVRYKVDLQLLSLCDTHNCLCLKLSNILHSLNLYHSPCHIAYFSNSFNAHSLNLSHPRYHDSYSLSLFHPKLCTFILFISVLTSVESAYPSSSSESTMLSTKPLSSASGLSGSSMDDCIMSEPEYALEVSLARELRFTYCSLRT